MRNGEAWIRSYNLGWLSSEQVTDEILRELVEELHRRSPG
jgi:hypothetical protein